MSGYEWKAVVILAVWYLSALVYVWDTAKVHQLGRPWVASMLVVLGAGWPVALLYRWWVGRDRSPRPAPVLDGGRWGYLPTSDQE